MRGTEKDYIYIILLLIFLFIKIISNYINGIAFWISGMLESLNQLPRISNSALFPLTMNGKFCEMQTSSVENVAISIKEAVRVGRLVPGQRLVEAEFTSSFGVSRGTIREAFARLVSDGLLNFERHRGVTVRLLTRKQVDDLFAIWASLESLAVRLALPRLRSDPTEMFDLLTKLNKTEENGDLQKFSTHNKAFHELFNLQADNLMLLEMNSKFTASVFGLLFHVVMDKSRILSTNQDHRDLVQAVLDGDQIGAQAISQKHFDDARNMVQELSDDFFKPS